MILLTSIAIGILVFLLVLLLGSPWIERGVR